MKKQTLFLVLLFLGLFLFPIESRADDAQSGVGFTVKAILPKSQIYTNETYFTPLLKPGVPQELQVEVISRQQEPITIEIGIQNGMTNSVGDIQYVAAEVPLDKTLKEPVTDLVKADQTEVTVANYETKRVTFTVTPPETPFDGIKIGALSFSPKEPSEEENKGIQNAYGYNIGIVLNEDQSDRNGADQLNLLTVEPRLDSGRRGVGAQLQNPTAHILDDLTIKTEWTNRERTNVLKTNEQKEMRMAPHSNFYFMTYWGVDDITPGKYSLKVTATSRDYSWEWWEDFEVTDKQAASMNKDAGFHLQLPTNFTKLMILLGIVTGIVLIGEGISVYQQKGAMTREKKGKHEA